MPVFSDLNLAFTTNPGTGDVLKKIDVEAVKTSIRNVLLGNPFDVPFDPNYGGSMRRLLFELLSPGLIAAVKRDVALKLAEYEPRCQIQNINIIDGENSVDVQMQFYVVGNAIIQSITLILERAR